MNKKLGQEPAFPSTEEIRNAYDGDLIGSQTDKGISTRLYIATEAMKGFIAYINKDQLSFDEVANLSFKLADIMLMREND